MTHSTPSPRAVAVGSSLAISVRRFSPFVLAVDRAVRSARVAGLVVVSTMSPARAVADGLIPKPECVVSGGATRDGRTAEAESDK